MRPVGEVSSSSGVSGGAVRMSYETDGSSEGSPRSHPSPPDGGVGSPTQSEASPGPCTSSHPNPGQKARNEAEKHRRDRINRGVNTICGMVGPAYMSKQQKKIDKITTLRLAANYMRRAFIHCFVASLGVQEKKSSLPGDIMEFIQNFSEDSGFWLTINRRGKILDATEGIQHLLGYNLVDVANEDLAKFVDSSQSDNLMTEKLLGYPDDCSEMVSKDVTLYMHPKPSGRKDSLRSGAPVHVRGFMGPIQSLIGTAPDSATDPGSEARQRLVPDDEVILVARVTPAGGRIQTYVEPRPENEYLLQVRSDGVIVGSDSRISLCAGFLPSEVRKKSAHSFLHKDDRMFAAVRQGLMFLFPDVFSSVTVRLINNTNNIEFVNVRGNPNFEMQKNLPPGHFTTRQIIISANEARKERCREMQHLQEFLRDVIHGKYPREQVQGMVQAIMGPMMNQLSAFDGYTSFNDPFSEEFSMCMFQMLAEFMRTMPTSDVSGWSSAPASSGDVQITELDSTTPGPPEVVCADPMPPPPPTQSALPMEPLRVDTYSATDLPADDLHTLLSSCSEDQWDEPVGAGPSPVPSDFGAAAQPSPDGLGGGGFRAPTNGLSSAQYPPCAAPQRHPSYPPAVPPQTCAMQAQQQSPCGYPAASPQSYVSASPQSCGVQSPAQSFSAASPQSRYSSMSPGQCYASPAANGQMMSPPYGQPVRQSCQFQPAEAPPAGYQETGMFLSPPQQQAVPGYSHSQEMSNRHLMTQPPDDAIMNWSHG
ncbi:uncharacterized protein LOC122382980 isoform X2 [Amphibalanus amphitrite]|uniref:uncharacterized protein LOC122382980 isoform X2 n=1 Tax=Amphibalanus amphitrite TaxID=1232801 RepID=UPI001C9007B2|nr:uncharacterized protein LOC122382980 isoform X2 [Amphibalanus amphitrite]